MLGLGLGSNKNAFSVSAAAAKPLSDDYIFTDDNLYGWAATTTTSGDFVSGVDYATYEDNSTTNVNHRIIRNSTDANLYSAEPKDIYYKIRIFRDDNTENLTGIWRVSAFGKTLTLDESDRELPFGEEKTYTGVIPDVFYSNQYYYVDFHKDPSEYGQEALTGGSMRVYSIQFANYDLSA
jgi:hypothetical protein